ncbi:NUDIX hydrolase [Paenibacillus methanolicus]|uniref:8-oxo-dGTP diphosphatase n=1 Tax=Paenibacillus methanolicus TaxID=582686 RepID=A0A5S5BVL7_9BACL|nr:8-oxo-dGTP diphosphatase [Paenibacillus methanolicus]TYP69643.1 8-oxo-dGTP diphosphatase [Paenibacillus methanolicus]
MLKYTIALIRRGDEVLMLNRNAAPNMGLWNGVGGKLEQGETPLANIVREIEEETGLRVEASRLRYAGTVTWTSEEGSGGMHAFIAELPSDADVFEGPVGTREGILDWKSPEWLFHPRNRGVVSNVPYFLPYMLEHQPFCEHHFTYAGEQLIAYRAQTEPTHRVQL